MGLQVTFEASLRYGPTDDGPIKFVELSVETQVTCLL